MRALVVLFFFFILLFVLGSMVTDAFGDSPLLPQNLSVNRGSVTNSNLQPAAGSIEVDRDDDVTIENPCTDTSNDCTLRDAIIIANSKNEQTTITFATHYLIRLGSPLPSLSASHTAIKARPEQEVHIDGNSTAGSVLRITGNFVDVIGLRIYGAGAGFPNITVSEAANNVVIAGNFIGDGDGPAGNCGSSESSFGGIYIDASGTIEDGARAWIYGNIIECHNGIPGEGITILSDGVIVGKDKQGTMDKAQRNKISDNQGIGINLNHSTGNVVSNNNLINNRGGGMFVGNLDNNDLLKNTIVDPS